VSASAAGASPVLDLRDRIRRGDISAEAAVTEALRQIDAVEPSISALRQTFADTALEAARDVDRRLASGDAADDPGALAGVPFTIKDNICIAASHVRDTDGAGARTTAASRILEHHRSPYDATVTRRLLDAGAICVGKTNLDEFGMGGSTENSAFGPTRNPWDTSCVPGGSSGGAAALCAATRGIIHLGSDTGGSIRQPASYCGVSGFKPTYGRVSRYGLLAFASSLDQIGPFGLSALDCALTLETIAGADPMDSTSRDLDVPDYVESARRDPAGLKIGIAPELFPTGVDDEVGASVDAAVDALRSLGVETREVSLPHARYANQVYVLISAAEASSNLARYDGVQYGHRTDDPQDTIDLYCRTRGEGFGPEVKRRIMVGTFVLSSGYYDAFYLKALKVRKLIRQDFDAVFEDVDAVICPTCPVTSFPIGDRIDDPLKLYALDVLTVPANLASLPAISIPCGTSAAGLPIGLQIYGRAMGDDVVLRLAHAFQSQTEHHLAVPPVSARGGEV